MLSTSLNSLCGLIQLTLPGFVSCPNQLYCTSQIILSSCYPQRLPLRRVVTLTGSFLLHLVPFDWPILSGLMGWSGGTGAMPKVAGDAPYWIVTASPYQIFSGGVTVHCTLGPPGRYKEKPHYYAWMCVYQVPGALLTVSQVLFNLSAAVLQYRYY